MLVISHTKTNEKSGQYNQSYEDGIKTKRETWFMLTFRRRIKFRLPFAGIIRRLPYFTRFQDKG